MIRFLKNYGSYRLISGHIVKRRGKEYFRTRLGEEYPLDKTLEPENLTDEQKAAFVAQYNSGIEERFKANILIHPEDKGVQFMPMSYKEILEEYIRKI